MSKKKDSLKPWLSRPAINRSVTLPLTRPLTQRLSNLNEFHPNELDPYLLFDARASMIGTLENPTLDLDPSKPDTLNVITATRAGVATFTDVNGNIASAPANTVRVDYVDSVPMILVEPSATNLLPYSEDFSHAGWSKQYDVAVTSSSANSPDGTTNAFKITGLESTDGDGGLLERVGASASTTYTFSAYLKALGNDDVGKKVRIRLKRNGGALVTSNQQVVLSSEWVRHSVTITLLSDNTGVDSMITKDTSSPTAERADECLVWGAQLETGSVATSYIPTSGSTVTRAADDLVITGSAFTDFYNQSEGTIYAESVTKKSDGQPFVFSANSDTSNRIIYYYNTTTTASVYVATGGVGQVNSDVGNRPSAGTLSRGSLSYKTNNVQGSVDGGSVVSDTSVSIPSVNKLTIGNRVNLIDQYNLNGHIKRLIYWPYHSDSL